jgi:hypothetical protein
MLATICSIGRVRQYVKPLAATFGLAGERVWQDEATREGFIPRFRGLQTNLTIAKRNRLRRPLDERHPSRPVRG